MCKNLLNKYNRIKCGKNLIVFILKCIMIKKKMYKCLRDSQVKSVKIINIPHPLKIPKFLYLYNSNQPNLTNPKKTNIIHINIFKSMHITLNIPSQKVNKTVRSTHIFKILEWVLLQTTKTCKIYTKNKEYQPIALLLKLRKFIKKLLTSKKRRQIYKNCKV